MKVVTLMENTKYKEHFVAEHGLSLYIETGEHRILFDTGQSAAFADNAKQLGVDLGSVDIAVLSHGHYDHSGGMGKFLEINKKAPVYLSKYAFDEYYHGVQRYIGVDSAWRQNDRLCMVEDEYSIADGLFLCSCNQEQEFFPIDSVGLTRKQEGVFQPDTFRHEVYLVIKEQNHKIVVSGCSHKGILNIMKWLHPDVLIGGFHFMKQEITETGNAVLDQAAELLGKYPTEYYTCHCTGTEQYEYMKQIMGDKLYYLSAGKIITI